MLKKGIHLTLNILQYKQCKILKVYLAIFQHYAWKDKVSVCSLANKNLLVFHRTNAPENSV